MEQIRTKGDVICDDIKIGDIHIENVYGQALKVQVITEPERFDNGGNDAYKWQSKVVGGRRDNEVIDYLVTSGFSHYGPELYHYQESKEIR